MLILSADTRLSKPQEGVQTLLKILPQNDRQKSQMQALLDAKSVASNLHCNLHWKSI